MPAGRPTKYDPAMCEVILREMSEGASIKEVCADLGIGVDAWHDYKEKYPEFSDAVKKGAALSEAWWMKQGRLNIHSKEFNSTLWYMNMKNRHQWSDRTESKTTNVEATKHEEWTDRLS